MKSLTPYLDLAGNAREAFEFYRKAFDGEIVAMQTFGEAGLGQDSGVKDKIMHAEFKAGGIHFMASDGRPNLPPATGNNVWLNVNLDDRAEQDRIWAVLAEGGEVTQPLNDTFWGARYGQVVDRFGIHWALNCL
jgi:PhnB protein